MNKQNLRRWLLVALPCVGAGCDEDAQASVLAQVLPSACAQKAEEIDQRLQTTMDTNSCLAGFKVDTNAATCAAVPGQMASWVCTECIAQPTNSCSNKFEMSIKTRVSGRTNGFTWSGEFEGTAGATFDATFMPGTLQEKQSGTGIHQPSFDYYSNRTIATATQNGGFKGEIKFDAPVPKVGPSLNISVEASCNTKVQKTYGRTNKVQAKKCGCEPDQK